MSFDDLNGRIRSTVCTDVLDTCYRLVVLGMNDGVSSSCCIRGQTGSSMATALKSRVFVSLYLELWRSGG
jgi:hypothetical protein